MDNTARIGNRLFGKICLINRKVVDRNSQEAVTAINHALVRAFRESNFNEVVWVMKFYRNWMRTKVMRDVVTVHIYNSIKVINDMNFFLSENAHSIFHDQHSAFTWNDFGEFAEWNTVDGMLNKDFVLSQELKRISDKRQQWNQR